METTFAVLYRFRLREGHEDAFIAAWQALTEAIRDHRGGRGSRLHRAEDGVFWAYAQWPGRAPWEADAPLPPEADVHREAMTAAIEEGFEPIPLDVVADLLVPETP